jgi:hypothetical protein
MTDARKPTKRPYTLAYDAGYNDALWGLPSNAWPWDDNPHTTNCYYAGYSAGKTEAALIQDEQREELDRQRSHI